MTDKVLGSELVGSGVVLEDLAPVDVGYVLINKFFFINSVAFEVDYIIIMTYILRLNIMRINISKLYIECINHKKINC